MELYIVDAFASRIFDGNQAGVVLLTDGADFPPTEMMQNIAAEFKYSETAFVKTVSGNAFELKYFTPKGEVQLCGHATISAFTVLRNEGIVSAGKNVARTLAGDLNIEVESDCIWMEMPHGELIKELSARESSEVYEAYGLDIKDKPDDMTPCIVNSGLSDILLPVNDKKKLDKAIQQCERVSEISRKLNAVGVHIFYHDKMSAVTAYCRNFAPLYGIDEEAATGTSTSALTYYLNTKGLIHEGSENVFVQGEAMGKPSIIKSKLTNKKTIYIGGAAVISVKGKINL